MSIHILEMALKNRYLRLGIGSVYSALEWGWADLLARKRMEAQVPAVTHSRHRQMRRTLLQELCRPYLSLLSSYHVSIL
jgi:hypothetical protein